MYLYFIRHGEPDYTTDTLKEPGKVQARLVANRLMKSRIDRIYSSPMGRAVETAQPLSELSGLPIHIEKWAYELGQETHTTIPDGVPKSVSRIPPAYFLQSPYRKMDSREALREIPCLKDTRYSFRYEEISDGLDDLLKRNGYERTPDDLFLPVNPNTDHIALFCHAAMLRSVISHLTNIPLAYLASSVSVHYTGITVFYFPSNTAEPCAPYLITLGDVGHLYTGEEPLIHSLLHEPF